MINSDSSGGINQVEEQGRSDHQVATGLQQTGEQIGRSERRGEATGRSVGRLQLGSWQIEDKHPTWGCEEHLSTCEEQ